MAVQHKISEGARLLRRFLGDKGLTVPEFCEAHGLCRIQVQRALKGERKRISVDFAKKIHAATEGTIPLVAWSSDTLRPVDTLLATGTEG
jgi:transcriptional regulator with XRE-family HTH domain